MNMDPWNFTFQNGLDLTIKRGSTNSPWACIREGLLAEGYLHLRFGGGAYFQEGIFLLEQKLALK